MNIRKKSSSDAAVLQQWFNVFITASIWVVVLDAADAVAVLPGATDFTGLRDE